MIPYRYIVIVGCGRLGSMLANQLSRRGRNVVVVDRDASAFDNLSTEFSGFRITGDAAELAILREAKIDEADCLLAVTRHDNVNLMVAQVGKVLFSIPKVVARVFDPSRVALYREFGIETICPTQISADMFLETLRQESQVDST
jgi:trk system potassium uptake protein TrkA